MAAAWPGLTVVDVLGNRLCEVRVRRVQRTWPPLQCAAMLMRSTCNAGLDWPGQMEPAYRALLLALPHARCVEDGSLERFALMTAAGELDASTSDLDLLRRLEDMGIAMHAA
jgi:hypothetical protein